MVASQQVEVCFLELRHRFYLELISPLAGNTKLDRYLGTGYYHLCFLVADLEAARSRLSSRRLVALPAFESEAFDGHTCQFFLGPRSQLIEICQMAEAEFEAFFSTHEAP